MINSESEYPGGIGDDETELLAMIVSLNYRYPGRQYWTTLGRLTITLTYENGVLELYS